MRKFIVLGGYGIIGKVVVRDLFNFNEDAEIIIAGRDLRKAEKYTKMFKNKRVMAKEININNKKELVKLLKMGDVCINCIQYYFNTRIMNACIEAKTNYLDLGGLFHETKKQLKLHDKFKMIGKVAVLGCGSTPGITNILALFGSRFLEKIKSIDITFADKDYTKYKQKFVLPYSFKTLIDEYTKNPAIFLNKKLKFVEPHSGVKEYKFPKDFGKQEGFYSLHSELATFPDSFKKKDVEKCEFRVTFDKVFSNKIENLIDLGFCSKEKIKIKENEVEILDFTSILMERFLPENDIKINNKEILRVNFDSGKLIIDCLAFSEENVPSGVYDTAIPCSIIAEMISKGLDKNGVYPPERVINPKLFFRELKKRGILVYKNEKEIEI